ncbi:MAG: MATE family efflux transporter [Nannocystaceae bacterium]
MPDSPHPATSSADASLLADVPAVADASMSGQLPIGAVITPLTADPVPGTLRRLAIPLMYGALAILGFNVVDTFFVGQISAEALAAVAFTFPVVFAVMSLGRGMGIGSSAVISRAIGAGDRERARVLTTASLLLATALVVVVAGIGLLTIDPLFTALGADPEHLALIHEYMEIWYYGVGFVVVPMVGNAAIRATGDTRTPSRVMITAAAANIVLDPLLIFGLGPIPALGIAGAALATALSYVITFAAALWILSSRERMLVRPPLRELPAAWRAILSIGGPAALTATLAPIATGWLTYLAATIDGDVVAAFGVVGRVEALAMIGVMGLSGVITPFMGQNLGAGLHPRIRAGYRYSLRFALLWGLGAAALLALTAPLIAAAFTDDPKVAAHITHLLWIAPISYGFAALVPVSASAANGLGRPLEATLLAVFRLLISVGLIAWLGAELYGAPGFFVAIALGNLAAGVFAWLRVRRQVTRCCERHPD